MDTTGHPSQLAERTEISLSSTFEEPKITKAGLNKSSAMRAKVGYNRKTLFHNSLFKAD